MRTSVLYWRRTDLDGVERLELSVDDRGVQASSTVICLEAGGFRLDHRWQLDREWQAQHVTVERWSSHDHGVLHLERSGSGWLVNGKARPDLDGAEEPDLSVTPFCNTLPIRRLPQSVGENLTLDTVFIDGPSLTAARSRQRYVRQSAFRVRYVDLGLSSGFEADLLVDADGLVVSYEHLFQRISPPVSVP